MAGTSTAVLPAAVAALVLAPAGAVARRPTAAEQIVGGRCAAERR